LNVQEEKVLNEGDILSAEIFFVNSKSSSLPTFQKCDQRLRGLVEGHKTFNRRRLYSNSNFRHRARASSPSDDFPEIALTKVCRAGAFRLPPGSEKSADS
jgi:hypothetical protein